MCQVLNMKEKIRGGIRDKMGGISYHLARESGMDVDEFCAANRIMCEGEQDISAKTPKRKELPVLRP